MLIRSEHQPGQECVVTGRVCQPEMQRGVYTNQKCVLTRSVYQPEVCVNQECFQKPGVFSSQECVLTGNVC